MSRWPIYDEEQIAAVAQVLRSGQVNAWTGSHVEDFERAYATHLGRKHAIALANGSLALDLALRIIGLKAGDEVIVTPRSFMASASCVPLAGGVPVFADVDPDSGNLTADSIASKIGPSTRAIILVHLAGWPCDMEPIAELAGRHGLWLIEDCAQAHGAECGGQPVGSFGDLGVFSFCQDKIITTGGEGGLLALDDDELFEMAWSFKDHGKSREAASDPDRPPGFRWLHESFGTNFRMTSIQAVLGQIQLGRLEATREIRARNASILIDGFRDIPLLRTPTPPVQLRHAWYRFYTFVNPSLLKPDWNRDRILSEVQDRGVVCLSGSCPEIYLEKAFTSSGLGPAQRLPQARLLGDTSLAFLIDPAQDEPTLARAVEVVRAVASEATDPRSLQQPERRSDAAGRPESKGTRTGRAGNR